jgi:UDP-glucose-4-epimerase GalE
LLETSSDCGPTVLVTGGAGYVGAHACKALRHAGYTPVVFDNLSTGHRSFVRWGPFVQGDIRDYAALLAAIHFWKPKAVLHFAAFSSVAESVSDPLKYYDNNLAGSLSLLRAMSDAGCGKLVFSSSCAVYGKPFEVPIRETSRLDPVNPYGASKAMVERSLADHGRAHGLQWIALRYFNASGADPDAEIGEMHEVETRLIPRAMMAIQGHIDGFAVFGTDYDTPDGTAIRDYVHVSDLAEAHVVALRRLLAGGPGGAFNLGTGRGYSVREVLDAIAAEAGQTLRQVKMARRPGDPPVLFADATLARSELGFMPVLSDLKSIIRTAWAWHRRVHAEHQGG